MRRLIALLDNKASGEEFFIELNRLLIIGKEREKNLENILGYGKVYI